MSPPTGSNIYLKINLNVKYNCLKREPSYLNFLFELKPVWFMLTVYLDRVLIWLALKNFLKTFFFLF